MPLVMAMNPRPAILRRLGRDGSEITIKTLVIAAFPSPPRVPRFTAGSFGNPGTVQRASCG